MKTPTTRALRTARRAWPIVLMGWKRWQQLPPERKDQYRQRARGYAESGRKALKQRRGKR